MVAVDVTVGVSGRLGVVEPCRFGAFVERIARRTNVESTSRISPGLIRRVIARLHVRSVRTLPVLTRRRVPNPRRFRDMRSIDD